MTERGTANGFEPWLTDELRRLAGAADDPLPAAVVARRAMDVGRGRRDRAARIRRWTPLVGLAAVLVLPTAFFLAGSNDRSPAPPSPPPPTADRTWDALLVRKAGGSAIDVVSVAADGRERPVRHHDFNEPEGQAPYPVGYLYGVATASSDGWLAVGAHAWFTGTDVPGLSDAWMLIDLRDASRPVQRVFSSSGYLDYASGGDVTVTQWPSAAAWGSGGRFVTVCAATAPCLGLIRPQLALQVVDASTGATRVIEGLARGPRDPLTWAADGSGVLTVADRLDAAEQAAIPIDPDNPYTLYWEPERSGLGIDPLDGGPRVMGVPSLVWRPGPRWAVEGGAWVDPDSGVGESHDGQRIDWAAELPEALAPGTTDWVGLSADARATWLLLAASPSTVVLAHATEPGVVTVRSAEVGTTAPSGIAGIAPDDSVIVTYVTPPSARATSSWGRVALIPTDGGRVRTYDGAFAGFIPADLFP
jgi:hypothetical protein